MLRKQPHVIQEKFYDRLSLFVDDVNNPLLFKHSLSGEWIGYSGINITGDVRASYYQFWIHTEYHFRSKLVGDYDP